MNTIRLLTSLLLQDSDLSLHTLVDELRKHELPLSKDEVIRLRSTIREVQGRLKSGSSLSPAWPIPVRSPRPQEPKSRYSTLRKQYST
jgi:hypothetical protein